MFALIACLHFNPDSACSTVQYPTYSDPIAVQQPPHCHKVTLLKPTSLGKVHAAAQYVQHPSLITHQSPATNTSRVGWKRRKGHLPGGNAFEGGICTSQGIHKQAENGKFQTSQRKSICISMLDFKEGFFGEKDPSKRSSRKSEHPSHPEQSGLVTPGAQEQQQSNTLNSPYPPETGEKSSLQ